MADLQPLLPTALILALATLLLLLLASFSRPKPFLRSLRHKHVLITGASSGIGLAIAKQSLLQGAYVTLVSRSSAHLLKALQSLVAETHCSPDSIRCEAADVTDYGAISAAVKAAVDWKPIDVLVCNAGLTRGGYLDATPIEELELTVRTNIMGTINALHAALPALKQHSLEKNPVSIVITASLAALFFLYGHTVYSATKYAVRGLAEGLRMELLPYNIKVSLICPSFTTTPFLDDLDAENQEICDVMQAVNLYKRDAADPPEAVAQLALYAMKTGRFLVASGPIGFILTTIGRGYIMMGEPLGRILMEAVCIGPLRLIFAFMSAFNRSLVLRRVAHPASTK